MGDMAGVISAGISIFVLLTAQLQVHTYLLFTNMVLGLEGQVE